MVGLAIVTGVVGYTLLTVGLIRVEEGRWPVVNND